MGTIQNVLTVIALSGMQLSLHCAQPVFGVLGVCKMGKHRGMTSHELCPLVPRHLRHLHLQLMLRWRLLLLHLLYCCQSGQSLGLLESASERSARLSLGVVVATAAGVPHPVVPSALAGHAFHLGACCQTSVESIQTSNLTL
jgi:hypothetical protein